ncbi:winged helix-turn-helix transcriptional regulator [Natronococcus wangiae]|uniref:winged helix-turn-helix transcriptional regulator n=1 Tax=Natronococcus wangiae TaxID=3068275 RepID=UPI00273EDA3B|nr:helix-turn-helix domain-containing protein [Natronococcus sp. AD5]
MSTASDWQRTWHSLRDLLGAKWSVHVLRRLSTGACGFNELKRELDGITATMLSRRLKELECHGLVDRSVAPTTPPTTTYRLTPRGRRFAAVLEEMESLVEAVDCDRPAERTCVGTDRRCLTVRSRGE